VQIYRIPFSTNVERVALGLGHKGLAVEWIDVDPNDRAEVERISGQPLVPVLVDDRLEADLVIVDSTVILRYLEELKPEPRLWPVDTARKTELDVFLDWFNRVWKLPPNEIEAERAKPEPDEARIAALGRELSGALDKFEHLLDGRDFLFGEFSAADCAAFPFLKYAVDRNADDDEPFHEILREFQRLDGSYPRLKAWIGRVDGLPRG
jgi:glutathione S-transferase